MKRISEFEEIVHAIHRGGVDAFVVEGTNGEEVVVLQTSENPYRVIAESLNDGAATLDEKGTILYLNGRLAQILGASSQKLLGTLLLDHLPRGRREDLGLLIRKQARGEVVLETGGVLKRTVRFTLSPVKNAKGRNICLIATDLTESLKMNEALKAGEESLRDLSARILKLQDEERRRIARDLHDVTGQEIGSIVLTLDYLARNFDKPGLDVKKMITETVPVAHKVADDIRTLSYLLHPPLLDQLGLGPAVSWYGEGFEKRSGIRVEVSGVDGFPRLFANSEIVLFRVLQEALTNVHRYSGSTSVSIQLATNKGWAFLTVEDRGKGIPISALQKTHDTGFGVGIPGMQERVRQLGGTLKIESSHNGTRVIAAIPSVLTSAAADVLEKPAAREPVDTRAFPEGRKRIMIVDDHELMRSGIRTLLESDPSLTVCAEAIDGADAIRKVGAFKPDLIIMDLSMPNLGGQRASFEIRKGGSHTKILVLTTHEADQLMAFARRTKYCDGYLHKSMASRDLLLAIHTILNGGTYFPTDERVGRVSTNERPPG